MAIGTDSAPSARILSIKGAARQKADMARLALDTAARHWSHWPRRGDFRADLVR